MNPLQYIPQAYRKILYIAWTAAGIIVGALNIAGVDTGATTDVLAYLGSALGLVAVSNLNTGTVQQLHPSLATPEDPEAPEIE